MTVPSGAPEVVPVAIVTQAGETNNPVIFDLSSDGDWNALRDEVRESFTQETGRVFPNGRHGVDIRLSAMTRDEIDALPEHHGW